MKGRSGRESTATRDKLLKAATMEFSERGYESASLRKICAHAGVTTGALYFLFENKEELLQEVLAPVEEGIEKFISAHEAAESGKADAALAGLWRHREAIEAMVKSRDTAVVSDFTGRIVELVLSQMSSDREMSRAQSRADDPLVVRWAANLYLNAIVFAVMESDDPDEVAGHLETMLELVRLGLQDISR